ncbi:biotin--[acetyl-CoA-carboxylase] ligase [Nitrospinota bacterium]
MRTPAASAPAVRWRPEKAGEVNSTNDLLLERARRGEAEGLAVWATSQRAGRGRMGRTWLSPPGCGLYFSALLRPPVPPEQKPLMSILAGAAIAEALAEIGGLPVGLKWPNDLRLDRNKVGGILCEYEPKGGPVAAVVVGVGINLRTPPGGYPEEIRGRAVSMEEAGCRIAGEEEMIEALLSRLGSWYRDFLTSGFEPLRRRWEELCDGIGRRVTLSLAGGRATGTVAGIDAAGHLLLEEASGSVRSIDAGEIAEP